MDSENNKITLWENYFKLKSTTNINVHNNLIILDDAYYTTMDIFDLLEIEPVLKPDSFFKNFENKLINFKTTKYDETLFNLNELNVPFSKSFDLIASVLT